MLKYFLFALLAFLPLISVAEISKEEARLNAMIELQRQQTDEVNRKAIEREKYYLAHGKYPDVQQSKILEFFESVITHSFSSALGLLKLFLGIFAGWCIYFVICLLEIPLTSGSTKIPPHKRQSAQIFFRIKLLIHLLIWVPLLLLYINILSVDGYSSFIMGLLTGHIFFAYTIFGLVQDCIKPEGRG